MKIVETECNLIVTDSSQIAIAIYTFMVPIDWRGLIGWQGRTKNIIEGIERGGKERRYQ